jgi:hypothetical protein
MSQDAFFFFFFFFFFAVLGLELRAFTLGHSTIPIFVKGLFEIGNYLPVLASNRDSTHLCLQNS